jgi:DNA-directed RNA polymerase subunit RPC12/RpoP
MWDLELIVDKTISDNSEQIAANIMASNELLRRLDSKDEGIEAGCRALFEYSGIREEVFVERGMPSGYRCSKCGPKARIWQVSNDRLKEAVVCECSLEWLSGRE